MPNKDVKSDDLPEDIKERFARVGAMFRMADPEVPYDAMIDFMQDIIGIYNDYLDHQVAGDYGTPTR